MSIAEAYNQWAENYDADRNLTRDLDEAALRQGLGGGSFASVIEIGCGTGKNTVFLAKHCERLLALDFSPGMLEHARRKVAEEHITFQHADLTLTWPAESQSAQLVVGNLVLEHIEQLDAVFTEAARCLGKGGHFYVSELHPARQYAGSQAKFEQGGKTVPVAAYTHHISDFLKAGARAGLVLVIMEEHWHPEDAPEKAPRLLTLLFAKVR